MEFKVGDRVRTTYELYGVPASSRGVITKDDYYTTGPSDMRYMISIEGFTNAFGVWWRNDNLELDVKYYNEQKLKKALGL